MESTLNPGGRHGLYETVMVQAAGHTGSTQMSQDDDKQNQAYRHPHPPGFS